MTDSTAGPTDQPLIRPLPRRLSQNPAWRQASGLHTLGTFLILLASTCGPIAIVVAIVTAAGTEHPRDCNPSCTTHPNAGVGSVLAILGAIIVLAAMVAGAAARVAGGARMAEIEAASSDRGDDDGR